MVNQKRIAEALNLSVMTVSRALRDHPDLTDHTKERVRRKAEELGYRKHLDKAVVASEKGAGGASVKRIGILLFEDGSQGEGDPLKFEVIRKIFTSIQKECRGLGIETPVETLSQDGPEGSALVKNRSVDSLVLLGRYSKRVVASLADIPALAVSSYVGDAGLPRVVADNVHGMREATEHLIALGHRDILFVGSGQANTQLFRERSLGYLAAMHSHGLRPEIVFLDREQDVVPVREILANTAVVCSNDNLAYHVQGELLSAGAELPRDCSIVSFDNIHAGEHVMPITSYEPDWSLLGSVAVGLLASLSPGFLASNIAVTIPGKMVFRDSACPPMSSEKQ